MSKFDSDDRDVPGYFLPEDGRFRLRKLHEQMTFLASLAGPRTAHEEEEDGPEIDGGQLAVCLELLADEVQRVLDAVSWPARIEAKRTQADADNEAEDAENAEDAEDAEDAQDAATEDDYSFGITLDQVDEINRRVGLLSAHGDLMMAGHGAELADHTLAVLGQAVFDDADAVHEIVGEVQSQPLDRTRRDKGWVREAPAMYGVVSVAPEPLRPSVH